MDLHAAIAQEHSKNQATRIMKWVGNDEKRFAELMHWFLCDDYAIAQRSAYPVSMIQREEPQLMEPWLLKMIDNLNNPVHDAIVRCTMRTLAENTIPENLIGHAADIAFTFLQSSEQPVAVKMYSMVTLHKICLLEPDLMPELKMIIEEQMPYAPPGFTSRGRKVLASIEKYMRKMQS